MKKNTFIGFILLLTLTGSVLGQTESSKEKITAFYQALVENLQTEYLHRDTTNWNEVREFVSKKTSQIDDYETALKVSSELFDLINCNHCQLFSENKHYTSTLNKRLSAEDFSEQFVLELEKKPAFHVKVIDENFAYIHMPGMLLIDLPQDELNQETQKMYDQIVAIEKNNSIKGWIVDLRFNIGGNAYPMLASLHYLLGDNVVYNTANKNGQRVKAHRLKNGGFYSGEKLETQATPTIEPNSTIPTAILIGKMTASAGENVAVAFKNRKNSILIGEQSYGFLTGNKLIELPYKNKIALTSSYITDKNNVYREFITPDIKVTKGDNFEDLLKDENIIQAIKFINKHSPPITE